MYDCMRSLQQVILEYRMVIHYICTDLYHYINEINLCLCYLMRFLIEIAIIKKKSNLS